jgi:hypothetical protein
MVNEEVMSSTILLSYLILVELVLPFSLVILWMLLRLSCSSKYACSIEFRFIVFRDVNYHIDLSLIVSIYSNGFILHVPLIFNKASFSSYSPSCSSLLAFDLSYR